MSQADPQTPLEKQIWDQLRLCYDYEIPVNIVDLGLIYEVKIMALGPEEHEVLVRMTFTSPMCPMGDLIKKDVERRAEAVPGVKKVSIEIVWDPPWDQTRMSEAAKLQLGLL
ncbi:MAG TPA: iron-sulfur cluster assembly protein [Candidatus Omnitrophota bacterium]|nr:iron-sulfur cluster assembly protein [Candidatus Omnitrophota bacterium]HRY85641.1 iron-sulfur cluster assembly protein [Candidatus Omnitrophota bacterium]